VQGLAREKKRLVLFSGAGNTALTNEQCSPYGFHWTYDTYGVSRGTASAVVKAGGDSWFILASGLRVRPPAPEGRLRGRSSQRWESPWRRSPPAECQ
jgi:hypothetical protein